MRQKIRQFYLNKNIFLQNGGCAQFKNLSFFIKKKRKTLQNGEWAKIKKF